MSARPLAPHHAESMVTSAISMNSTSRMCLDTLVDRESAGLNRPGEDGVGRDVRDGRGGASETEVDRAAIASRSKPPRHLLLE